MRRRRLKKYLLITVLVAVTMLAGAIYIASIALPVKCRTFLSDELKDAITKKIFIRSIHIDPLKGIVLEGVVIYDNSRVYIRAKEISAFIIYSRIFQKKVIIPFIRVDGLEAFVERLPDGTLNLKDFVSIKYAPPKDITISIHRLIFRRGRIDFIDNSVDPIFKREAVNFNGNVALNIPSRIVYKFTFDVRQRPIMPVEVAGEYILKDKKGVTAVTLKNITPGTFASYMGRNPVILTDGLIDAVITLTRTGGRVDTRVTAQTRTLALSAGLIRARLDSSVQADVSYNAQAKRFEYSGFADVASLDLNGLEPVGDLSGIKGKVHFDNTRIWCDTVNVTAFGIPWQVRFNLANFSSPIIDIYANSAVKLGSLQKSICESCKTSFPVELAGDAKIYAAISMEHEKPPKMNGSARFSDVTMRLGSGRYPVEHISGEVKFTPQQLEWSSLKLVYRQRAFIASGTLTDLASPSVRLKATSDDLSFDSAFSMNGSVLALAEFAGRYLNSKFSVSGDVDISDPTGADADLRGSIDMDLKDLIGLKGFAWMSKMKPSGMLKAEFIFKGNTKNITDSLFRTKVVSPAVSIYSARFTDAAFDYAQADGIGEIKTFRAKCYGGTISANGKVNWRSEGEPFSISLDAQDIMLEKIKADTGFKDADVSGDIKLYANLTGLLKDQSRLNGLGRLTITDGRLWQLNLFNGLGKTIFTSDFSSIVFSEGSCDFRIAEKAFYADSVDLKGELMRLSGSGSIGFDKSISAVLRPEINENAMWAGTQRNIAMAVQNGTVVEITGTLKDPVFKNRTDVLAVVGSVAGALLKRE